MENKIIAKSLRLLSQLMELHNENAFKVRSMANAAYKVDKLPFQLSQKPLAEIEQIDGIGKSTASKIGELLAGGIIKDLEDLLQQTPQGVVEMLGIKGIGPKKINTIWKELNIENIGELYYACNENRLVEAKGFGLKTQEEIKKIIEFKMAGSGCFIFARVEVLAEELLDRIKSIFPEAEVSFTGEYRRRCEVISELTVLVGGDWETSQKEALSGIPDVQITAENKDLIRLETGAGIKVNISFCPAEDFAWQLVLRTGSDTHVEELKKRLNNSQIKANSEQKIYQNAGLPFIVPELREALKEFEWAEKGKMPELITFNDLRGCLHNHSTWSDGVHTLEEMALFCRDVLKLEYLGICDHSKSAFYANGLTESRVIAQQEEIDTLNKKLFPFKIFKGIESDILFDGSLDYPSEILATFDFVVASVHSVLKMNEEKATDRLIKAIENPFTTILGHPTGRLLLSRAGYPIVYKKVIDACAANQVVIEINANPLRLDMDWRWHHYAIEKEVLLSINPDAHRNEGFYDMRYGVLAARKGGVSPANCLNAMNLEEINGYFQQKKSH